MEYSATTVVPPPLPDRAGDRRLWGPIQGAARDMLLADAAARHNGPCLVITADPQQVELLKDSLEFFLGDPEVPVLLFPDRETLPYDNFSPHEGLVSERLDTLNRLPQLKRGIVIVPAPTLMNKLPPPVFVHGNSLRLHKGQRLDINEMRRVLQSTGYQCVTTVYAHGEYALRGAILDIFPMGSELPLRIDMLDDEIDTLRTFDPDSQRTLEKIDQIALLPAREFPLDERGINTFCDRWHEFFPHADTRHCLMYQDIQSGIAPPGIEYFLPLFFEQTSDEKPGYDKASHLFDYLPDNTLVLTAGDITQVAEHYWHEIENRYDNLGSDIQRPLLKPADAFLTVDSLMGHLRRYPRIDIRDNIAVADSHYSLQHDQLPDLTVNNKLANPLHAMASFLDTTTLRVLLCAESAGRREHLLDLLRTTLHDDIPVIDSWQAFLRSDYPLAMVVAPLANGFVLPQQQIAVISESELFGERTTQHRRRRGTADNPDAIIRNLAELKPGSPVVHIEHGVGRFRGLKTLTVDETLHEFIHIEYADEANLYVPVASLQLLSRYSGTDEEHAPLHRLGTEQWQKIRKKALENARDVAAELLEIHARRAARQGFQFTDPGHSLDLFGSEFPFEETRDQVTAIEAVRKDMTSANPMDRLVCGDVGFGKTEVAMRAAFIAVHSGKQVVILVPTTLLAQQHYETFSDRFANWPVTIDVLSRFRSAKEQQAIIDKLVAGQLDIIIGTHKLLQGNIDFSRLGLVIIDEEHRFGVHQKEKLKALRAEVDILTLTATPIPRTLNMAMSGMRDLSIIATPPARRLSVKTFVRVTQPSLIKEAILRELLRGGQVYYLHNDVQTIEKTRDALQALVPDARIGIGHGQMRERNLEQVMQDFYHQRFNILVCTTIIETGIDVPSANTIIIDRADKFGLAQLHQLRGRVGRSHHQAYAYLLTPDYKNITPDAQKRLDVISMAGDLGAGFTLATHDMEIRGAGELLGDSQSGQIQSVGFELYMEILQRAVEAIKEGRVPDTNSIFTPVTEINLRAPALIPETWLGDPQSRLVLYKRIANTQNHAQLRDLQVEMIDRFGLLTDEIKNLMHVTRLRQHAAILGITRIDAGVTGGFMEFGQRTTVDPLALVTLVQTDPARYQFGGPTRLKFKDILPTVEERFLFVDALLTLLEPAANVATGTALGSEP